MILTPKLVIGGLVAVALAFGVVEGCDRWNARQREKADRERHVADSLTRIARPADVRLDSLIRAIDAERVQTRLIVEQALSRADRDRTTRIIEYRQVTDTFALALLHRKDTTIDSLSVALEREVATHDKTKFALDTMTVSRGRWITIAETRKREADALRRTVDPWWKKYISPKVTVGYGAVLAKSGTVQHGFGAQLGIQIFP
jgi:hypothetical protein